MVCQDRRSLTAVVSQDRFHCIADQADKLKPGWSPVEFKADQHVITTPESADQITDFYQ